MNNKAVNTRKVLYMFTTCHEFAMIEIGEYGFIEKTILKLIIAKS